MDYNVYSHKVVFSSNFDALEAKDKCPVLNNPGKYQNFAESSFHTSSLLRRVFEHSKNQSDTEVELEVVLAWGCGTSSDDVELKDGEFKDALDDKSYILESVTLPSD